MTNQMISIILPTYNEAGSLEVLLPALEMILRDERYEILVVDDQSSDGTQKVVRKLARKGVQLKLIVRKEQLRNLGKSVLEGIRKAEGDLIIGMDADNNHDPKYLKEMIRLARVGTLVVGSRFVGKHRLDNRREFLGSYAFNFMARLLGMPIWDNTSGYYAIHYKDLRKLPLEEIYRGYGDYHLRLIAFAKIMNMKFVEVPIKYGVRIYGRSKSIGWKMLVSYLWEIMRIRVQNTSF